MNTIKEFVKKNLYLVKKIKKSVKVYYLVGTMTTESLQMHNFTTIFGNSTTNETYINLLRHPVHRTVIYSIAYSLVFLCALFGNLMVVLVVYRNASMHNATNYFIVNLAIADILVAIFCVPITLLDNLYQGKFRYK